MSPILIGCFQLSLLFILFLKHFELFTVVERRKAGETPQKLQNFFERKMTGFLKSSGGVSHGEGKLS